MVCAPFRRNKFHQKGPRVALSDSTCGCIFACTIESVTPGRQRTMCSPPSPNLLLRVHLFIPLVHSSIGSRSAALSTTPPRARTHTHCTRAIRIQRRRGQLRSLARSLRPRVARQQAARVPGGEGHTLLSWTGFDAPAGLRHLRGPGPSLRASRRVQWASNGEARLNRRRRRPFPWLFQ